MLTYKVVTESGKVYHFKTKTEDDAAKIAFYFSQEKATTISVAETVEEKPKTLKVSKK